MGGIRGGHHSFSIFTVLPEIGGQTLQSCTQP
jgi:hypothetical protein